MLYQGDCLEEMSKIPDGSVDLVLADPPYGTTACKWDSIIPFNLMWNQINRVAKRTAAIALFGSEPFSSALRMSNIKSYKYDWVWEKSRFGNQMNAKKQPLRIVENILVFYSTQPTYNPQNLIEINKETRQGKMRGGILDGKPREQSYHQQYTNYPKNLLRFASETRTIHPTQKPVPLLEYLVSTYTKENEIVLDFTMGSGSTGIACINTGRRFIGIELDKGYYDIAYRRIKETQHIVV